MAKEGNGKVKVAILTTDMEYLKKSQDEMKQDIKEIKEIFINGSNKIAKNTESINSLWKVFSIVGGVLTLAVAVLGLILK